MFGDPADIGDTGEFVIGLEIEDILNGQGCVAGSLASALVGSVQLSVW